MVDLSFSLMDLEYFLLIFVRVSCFVFIAPFFSMQNTPRGLYYGADAIPKEWLEEIPKKKYVEDLCEKASLLQKR